MEPIDSDKEFLEQVIATVYLEDLNNNIYNLQLKEINQSHFDDIVEERHITNLCGYPLCSEKLKEYVQ